MFGVLIFYKANDVARVSVPVTTATDSLEALSMVLPKRQWVVLNMGWDKVRVAVPFTKFIYFIKKALCFVNTALFLVKLNH
jgi:hypothetical protein